MKKTWAKPKPCVRWGLFDSAGELVLIERKPNLYFSEYGWRRVRVVPMTKAADMAAFLHETSPKRRKET